MKSRYVRSKEMLERALHSIPLGSQTFSKSHTQYPKGVSPHFIVRGAGGRVWDIDGNEYVDFVNGLASITLGYGDPDVNSAVERQLRDGVVFSLPHPLEVEVAEKIVEMVPCAEQVRFGKNGSDATAGAIRLARAFTGRDRVAVCGYHGWQDWYIGSTSRNRGVPAAVRALTHTFQFNDLESLHSVLDRHPGEFAAVILEPMNSEFPAAGFLEGVRDLASGHGALLVFDETITGFRFSNGGAQELFGVTPDLATFGKGLANGFPLSAIAGSERVMRLMEEIFFSFTFGGEALSLAASLATLTKLQNEPVVRTLTDRGSSIMAAVGAEIEKCGLSKVLRVSGHPTWSFLDVGEAPGCSAWEIYTLILQEMFERGCLTLGTHNVSYAHTDEDLEQLLGAYAETFSLVGEAVSSGSVKPFLRCQPLEPLFKVR